MKKPVNIKIEKQQECGVIVYTISASSTLDDLTEVSYSKVIKKNLGSAGYEIFNKEREGTIESLVNKMAEHRAVFDIGIEKSHKGFNGVVKYIRDNMDVRRGGVFDSDMVNKALDAKINLSDWERAFPELSKEKIVSAMKELVSKRSDSYSNANIDSALDTLRYLHPDSFPGSDY